jgi:membrane protease YdiL (CAAX protease family)
MLVAFVVVGIGMLLALRSASAAPALRGLPAANLGIVVVLFAAFLVVQRAFVRLPMTDVGLRRFADWTRRERLYFLQVVPLAAVVFAVLFRGHLRTLLGEHGLLGFLLFSVLTGLAWGMVQEFLYRGWLQTELTRRFGATAGLLAANVAFTFGPLHIDYFSGPIGVRWDLVAVFCIGLFFGIVYRRSGNLWIPAVLHGLWPLNMT